MPLYARVDDAIKKSGERAAAILTVRLRAQAVQMGWPSSAAAKLQVKHKAGSFEASFVGAEDWEYGIEGRAPLSVARTFNIDAHRQGNDLVTQALESELADIL